MFFLLADKLTLYSFIGICNICFFSLFLSFLMFSLYRFSNSLFKLQYGLKETKNDSAVSLICILLLKVLDPDGKKSSKTIQICNICECQWGRNLFFPSVGPPPQHRQQHSTATNSRNKGTSTPASTAPLPPAWTKELTFRLKGKPKKDAVSSFTYWRDRPLWRRCSWLPLHSHRGRSSWPQTS